MKKIISISTKDNFIKVFTEELLFEKHRKDYSDICVIFPGKRPFLYMRKTLASMIGSAFYPPKMFTIDEFIEYITEKEHPGLNKINKIDGISQLFHIIHDNKLLQSITDLKKNRYTDFLDFYPWTKKIYDFINMADIEDVEDKTLKNIQDNAEIGYNVPEQINTLFINIVKIRSLFHNFLEQENLFTRGYEYLKAKEIIERTDPDEFKKIYFAGLFGLTGTEKKIIKKLLSEGSTHLIWHGHPDQWGILKGLKDYFNEEMEIIKKEKGEKEKNIHLYSAFDLHCEAELVYRILKKEKKIEDTVIVTPKNDTLFPLLSFAVDRLISLNKIDKFNISLDYPVKKTSLFSLVKNLIESQLNIRKKEEKTLFYTQSYINFLSNPFIKNIKINKTPFREVLKKIRAILTDHKSRLYNRIFIGLDEIEASLDKPFKKIAGELHKVFFKDPLSAQSMKDICINIEKGLDFILKKSDIRSYILSGRIFNLLFEELLSLKESSFSDEKFLTQDSRIKLWGFFLKLIEESSIKFDTVPLQDLEIIGMLETRILNFKNIIILDLQEGIIPVQKKIDPLIPVTILESIGMPPPEFQEEIYEYYFYRLIENSDKVHLLYLDTPEADRSRFIEHLIWEEEKEKKKLNIKKIGRIKFKINLMPGTDNNYIEKNTRIIHRIRSIKYSPSAVDNFLFCQIKFYYNNILNLFIPRTLSTDIDATDRGMIVHDILKDLFNKFKGEKLSSDNFLDLTTEFTRVFENKFKNITMTGEFYLFKKMAFKKLSGFLNEHVKKSKNEFTVLETEKSMNAEYKFNSTKINIKGRIDRVDMVNLGPYSEYMIIDYKTGNSSERFQFKEELIKEKNTEKIREYVKSLQLPIYIYLYMNEKKNIKIDRIDAKLVFLGDIQEKVLLRNKKNIKLDLKKEEIYNYYNILLKTVLNELFDRERPFIKYRDLKCEYCEYSNLCKFK